MSNFSPSLQRTLCLKSLEEIIQKPSLLIVLPCMLIVFRNSFFDLFKEFMD